MTGRSPTRWIRFILDNSAGLQCEIPIDSISPAGFTYNETELTAWQDKIKGFLASHPDADIDITGPFDTSPAVLRADPGLAPVLSGSHTVLAPVSAPTFTTPLGLSVCFGDNNYWNVGDPVFGIPVATATSGYTCTKYNIEGEKYSARFVPDPSVPYWGSTMGKYVTIPLSPVPVSDVADRPALSAQLWATDSIHARFNTEEACFADFTQTEKAMIFTIADDGYVIGDLSGVPAAITAILDSADTYNCTALSYNLEWPAHTSVQIQTRLEAIRAELIVQSSPYPLIFAPINSVFYNAYALFADYCDGYGVQLQGFPAESEGYWARDAMDKANSVMANPIMSFQIRAYPIDRTAAQVIRAIQDIDAIEGNTACLLIFSAAQWAFCQGILDEVRP